MKKNLDRELLCDIKDAIEEKRKKIGKPAGWFRYARYANHGYVFLKHKEKQWEILNEVAIELSSRYPKYTQGEIVDLISEMVNKTAPTGA